jgi:hypothetical protein
MPIPSWETWFRENRRRLANNGLYLDGGEPGRQDPREFHRASTWPSSRPRATRRF